MGLAMTPADASGWCGFFPPLLTGEHPVHAPRQVLQGGGAEQARSERGEEKIKFTY